MRKSIIALLATILLSNFIYAGKNLVPATSKVVPVTTISPNPIYVGVGLIGALLHRDPCPCLKGGKDLKDTRFGGIVRVGMDFNQYLGVEARYLKTLESDVFSKTTHYGLFLKPQYHISNNSNIYALLGYGRTTISMSNGITSCKVKKSGFSYGIGLELDISKDKRVSGYKRGFDGQGDQEKSWGLWIDYQRLFVGSSKYNVKSHVVSVGITYDF
jgi:opacity protein-like surface antigen